MSLIAKPFEWLLRAGGTRLFWLGCPLLVYAWTLGGPFLFDDLHLLLKTERYIDGQSDRLDLFRFARTDEEWRTLRDRGTFPWWSPEQQRIDLFRPLAEWSFYLDVRMFGRNPLGHRLVSLLWFALALICVHRLYVTACADRARAGVAAFLFGISQTVTQPATFISNRSDLFVVVGTALAAWAYCRAGGADGADAPGRHRIGRVRLVLIAAGAFGFALLSKEMAFALACVVAAHTLLARLRRRPSFGAPAVTGVVCLMGAVYIAYYAWTRPWHLGLSGDSGVPSAFLTEAPRSIALYLAVWTLGFPIGVLVQAGPVLIAAVSAAGAAAGAVVALHLRRLARVDRATPFFILWSVLFLLPALMTNPESRVLCAATVGWAYLLAALLAPRGTGAPPRPLWLRHWLFAANGAVSIACAVGIVVVSNQAERQATRHLNRYLAGLERPLESGDTLIVAEAQSPLEFICAGDRLTYVTGRKNVSIAYLTSAGVAAEIRREDDHTLLVTSTSRPLLGSRMHQLTLGPTWKPVVGREFRLEAFTAQIAEVTPEDTVGALRFVFSRPLASPRLHYSPPSLAATARGADAPD